VDKKVVYVALSSTNKCRQSRTVASTRRECQRGDPCVI
jgi:hypothetical protein